VSPAALPQANCTRYSLFIRIAFDLYIRTYYHYFYYVHTTHTPSPCIITTILQPLLPLLLSITTIIHYCIGIREVGCVACVCIGKSGDIWLGQRRVPVVQGERWTTSHAIASRATVLLSRTSYISFRFFPIFFHVSHIDRRPRHNHAETTTRYSRYLTISWSV